MTYNLSIALTLLAALLVVYHHLGYPLLLRLLSSRRLEEALPEPPTRAYRSAADDALLPTVAIVIPAYNEEEHVADKIRNLAMLDYPNDRLRVYLACDGCTDDTAAVAWRTAREPECRELRLEVIEFASNRGKIAVLNQVVSQVRCDRPGPSGCRDPTWGKAAVLNAVVPSVECDLLALSDVSALISVDALLIAVERFRDPRVGVVSGAYRLLNPSGAGEAAYWRYQSEIKRREGALGATMGVHGAFYMLRRRLFEPLELDVINDDFILPMRIVARGYRALYEPRIQALELEAATLALDRNRRRRIAAGNLQQLVRLSTLLRPSYRGIAFVFASGKALRALMPFVLLALLAGSALLAPAHPLFLVLLIGQIIVYGLAFVVQRIGPGRVPAPLQVVHYLVQGHLVGLIGSLRYLLKQEGGRWKRANIAIGK